MPEEARNIRNGKSDARRSDLIHATLRVIAKDGVKAATVRSISKEANVTQGLIRYYFNSKNDLLMSAYEMYMGNLVNAADKASRGKESARKRLASFIQVSLEEPVTSHSSIAIWAGFFEFLLHDKAMRESHKRGYDSLRLHLKALISDVLNEIESPTPEPKLRRLSIAGNAILDGLWMEGGALPDAFREGELTLIGLESFSALLGTDLCELT